MNSSSQFGQGINSRLLPCPTQDGHSMEVDCGRNEYGDKGSRKTKRRRIVRPRGNSGSWILPQLASSYNKNMNLAQMMRLRPPAIMPNQARPSPILAGFLLMSRMAKTPNNMAKNPT